MDEVRYLCFPSTNKIKRKEKFYTILHYRRDSSFTYQLSRFLIAEIPRRLYRARNYTKRIPRGNNGMEITLMIVQLCIVRGIKYAAASIFKSI